MCLALEVKSVGAEPWGFALYTKVCIKRAFTNTGSHANHQQRVVLNTTGNEHQRVTEHK